MDTTAVLAVATAVSTAFGAVITGLWQYQKHKRDAVVEEYQGVIRTKDEAWQQIVKEKDAEIARLGRERDGQVGRLEAAVAEMRRALEQVREEAVDCRIEAERTRGFLVMIHGLAVQCSSALEEMGKQPPHIPALPDFRPLASRSDFAARTAQQVAALAGTPPPGGTGP